jgi:hypothetical protein
MGWLSQTQSARSEKKCLDANGAQTAQRAGRAGFHQKYLLLHFSGKIHRFDPSRRTTSLPRPTLIKSIGFERCKRALCKWHLCCCCRPQSLPTPRSSTASLSPRCVQKHKLPDFCANLLQRLCLQPPHTLPQVQAAYSADSSSAGSPNCSDAIRVVQQLYLSAVESGDIDSWKAALLQESDLDAAHVEAIVQSIRVFNHFYNTANALNHLAGKLSRRISDPSPTGSESILSIASRACAFVLRQHRCSYNLFNGMYL